MNDEVFDVDIDDEEYVGRVNTTIPKKPRE
jgi:hypothetical protein